MREHGDKPLTAIEDILVRFFQKGKKRPIFLKCVKRDHDGNPVKCFTKYGGEVYEKFVKELYHLGSVFGTLEDAVLFCKSLECIGLRGEFSRIIDETDAICDRDYQ